MLNELEKAGTIIKRETLNTYIKILCDAKILYECNRFDLKSKKSIAGEKKYYLSDLGYSYLQICMTIMSSKETEEREYRPLETIKDNYPKYVLTRSDPIQHRNGIIHKNMPDLMKNGESF